MLVVGTGLILRRCSTLEEFVEAFRVATLPAANALRAISEGSVCFTVQAENRSALEALWGRYQDGTLRKDLQEFLVTEEMRQLAEREEVVVTVYIDEQEFRNILVDLKNVEQQGNSPKKIVYQERSKNHDVVIWLLAIFHNFSRGQMPISVAKLTPCQRKAM